MIVHVYGNPVTITSETITATRQWYADNALACIADAESGEAWVRDLSEYREWQTQQHSDALDGKWDHTFAFVQRAIFIQTGKSVPMLEK